MIATMETDLFTTLDESKGWLQENVDDGAICPCCHRLDKVYNRKVSISMVSRVFDLYRYATTHGAAGWHSHRSFVSDQTVGRDFPLLRFIGLLDMEDSRDKSKKTSGSYRINLKGVQFCRGDLMIPERLIIYHNELIGVSTEEKHIQDFWPNFNYQELMGAE